MYICYLCLRTDWLVCESLFHFQFYYHFRSVCMMQRHVTWPTCVPAASTDGHHQSRSAVSGALMVPWTRTSTGQCSFAVYGPRTWNRLPTALQPPELLLSYSPQSSTSSRPTCSSTRQCWLQLWVLCTILWCCCDCTVSSAPTTNVQTQLDSRLTQFSTVTLVRSPLEFVSCLSPNEKHRCCWHIGHPRNTSVNRHCY